MLDFNKDGWMDVALTHAGSPGITLWRNVQGKSFERVPLPVRERDRRLGTNRHRPRQRWLARPGGGGAKQSRGRSCARCAIWGPPGFEDVTASVKLDQVKLTEPRALIAGDVDGDGAADLIVTQPDGNPSAPAQ